MKTLKESKHELNARLNTVLYVMKSCPEARQDGERFVDDSVTIHNADGFVFRLVDQRTITWLTKERSMAHVTPYKKLKRRPNEKDPLKIYGTKDYDLARKHIELLLNNIDHRQALRLLQKALKCQDKAA